MKNVSEPWPVKNEHYLIGDRAKAGLDAAWSQVLLGGRKKVLNSKQITEVTALIKRIGCCQTNSATAMGCLQATPKDESVLKWLQL